MSRFLVYGLSNGCGGVESIVMAMVEKLGVRHQFEIIVGKDACQYETKYSTHNIKFLHFPSWGEERKAFVSSVAKQFKSVAYDFVWINGCIMSNRDIISVTRKYSNAKIITHSHGSLFEENSMIKRFILQAMHYLNRRYYLKNVDIPCMCSTRSGIWYYGGKYLLHHSVHIINNGINITSFEYNVKIREEYRNELGLTDEIALFHAGRLTQVKNQQFLLEIMSDLRTKSLKFKLFIAGEGELEQQLKDSAKRLGVEDSVSFMGRRNDIDKLYQAMDIFLLPSFHEGFPVTLTEAQASGLYCIVSDNVSNETNLTGNVDYIQIDSASRSKWVNTIVHNAQRHLNRDKMATMLKHRGFDIESVCNSFERILNL